MSTFHNTLGSALLFFSAITCGRASNHFDFRAAFDGTEKAYFGPDERAAREALAQFVHESELNESTAKKAPHINYDAALAMSWLRLASIYELDNEKRKYDDAMERAIRYFDRSVEIAQNPDYKRDKRKYLAELLRRVESVDMPQWKKSLMTAEKMGKD
jgi:hypothetical protein